MTTSGTYDFSPGIGELVIYAFNLCGIRPTELVQEHMTSARMASNLLMGRWSSQGVNLWQVDLQTVALVEGTATYSVPVTTIAMLDAYVTIGSGSTATDRIVLPISRSEYASYPNKAQEGSVTTFWFDRLLTPTVTLFQVPDGTASTFSYYRIRQNQDAGYAGGQTPELPIYFLEAFALGLAFRLALIWAADRAAGLKQMADEAYGIAIDQNVETSQFFLSPAIGGYFQT